MTISSVTGSTSTADPTAAANPSKSSSSMDKDAFLKLLIAQLQHQDPLQPTEGTEYVTQLAQFSIVEQSQQQSKKLDTISTQMNGLASNEAAGLVGKSVTLRSANGIAWDGLTATGASVNLEAAAAKVTVQIQDASGKTVRTLELGAHAAGAASVRWDGKSDAGEPVPKGAYGIKVVAATADGKGVNVTQDVTGTVTKIVFDKGYPELHLDSGATAPISDLVGVGGNVK